MADDDPGWFSITGIIVGLFAAGITFIAVYIAAVASVGWVVGIALGWIPASLAASLAFLIGRYLWWLAVLLLAVAVYLLLRD